MRLSLPLSPEFMHDEAARLVALLAEAPPGPVGVVRLEVVLPEGGTAGWTLRLTADSARLDERATPDAVLRAGLDSLLAWARGETDGALLHLSGALEVAGDEELALALATSVRLPGSDRFLVDAGALDPLAVRDAIAGVPTAYLDRVMSGAFRGLVLDEVFRRMPEFLDPEKGSRVRVAVMFEVERPGGEPDRYVVRIDEGRCEVVPGASADAVVDATLVLAGHEFLRLVLGHLNPVRGVLSGDIRVRGQLLKALGFNSVMNIPGS